MNASPPCGIELLQGGVFVLSYDICHYGDTVGKVTLEQQGLYYLVRSRCKRMDGLFRLSARCEKGSVMLGVFVPEGAHMFIEKRIPMKQLGGGPHSFVLIGNKEMRERFAPLDEELPTECLRSLEQARFAVRDGRAGLLY